MPARPRAPPAARRRHRPARARAARRGTVDAGASIAAELTPAQLPPTLAGLKLVCKTPGAFRVFVDSVDTGRSCPVDERIPVTPGSHRLTLYAPAGDRTVEVQKPATVDSRLLGLRGVRQFVSEEPVALLRFRFELASAEVDVVSLREPRAPSCSAADADSPPA